jgi:hypothetical protein
MLVATQPLHPMFRCTAFSNFVRGNLIQLKAHIFDNYLRSSVSDIVFRDRNECCLVLCRPMKEQQFWGYQDLARWSYRRKNHLSRRPFQTSKALSRPLSSWKNESGENEEIEDRLCWGFRKHREVLELLKSEHHIAWQLVSNDTFILCFVELWRANCNTVWRDTRT